MDTVYTEKAPAALGPYSQAIVSNGMIYCSGQIPVNPLTGTVEAKTIGEQAAQSIANLSNVLEKAGSSLAKVVKTTVFIKNMDDFAALNKVYADAFGGAKPARSCVEVSRLPKDVLVEIECIAEA